MVGQGGGEEARGGGVRGVLVCAGRNRAAVDVDGDAQRRSLGNDETSLALQVGVEGSAAKAERGVRGGLRQRNLPILISSVAQGTYFCVRCLAS